MRNLTRYITFGTIVIEGEVQMSTEKKLTKEELIDLRNWLNKTINDFEGLISDQLPVPEQIQKAARGTLKILENIKILLDTVERFEGVGEEKKEFAAKILQFPTPKPMFSNED